MNKGLIIVIVLSLVAIVFGCGYLVASKVRTGSIKGVLAIKRNVTSRITGNNFDRKQLIQIAIDNQKNSYAPYSKYNVSAAVLMSSGKIYAGVNVENASYPAGICAERNAIFDAIECGETQIIAVAIVGGRNYSIKDYCTPCGICRQVMREFCNPKEMRVIFAKSPSDYKEMTLDELLPESFGPDVLKK